MYTYTLCNVYVYLYVMRIYMYTCIHTYVYLYVMRSHSSGTRAKFSKSSGTRADMPKFFKILSRAEILKLFKTLRIQLAIQLPTLQDFGADFRDSSEVSSEVKRQH